MKNYTDIASFLDQLARDVDSGIYSKATLVKALSDEGWAEVVSELSGDPMPLKQDYIAPFRFIGILTIDESKAPYTYASLSQGIEARLKLVKFALEHVKDLTATRH